MSHPAPAGNIQSPGPDREPTAVPKKGQHEIGTMGEAVPNTSGSAANPAARVALNPKQGVEVKTDLTGSPDYKREPLTQEAVAGMGATAKNGPEFNDGRKR